MKIQGLFRIKIKIILQFIMLSIIFFPRIIHGAAPAPIVTYNLEINENNWRTLNVSISIQNNTYSHLLCFIPGSFAPNCLTNEAMINFSNFNAVGESELDPTFIRVNEETWLVDTNNNNVIFISYSVSQLIDPILSPSIGRNFVLINGSSVLMCIREIIDFPIKLVANVPYDWKLATCLEVAGEDFQYSAQNYDELISNPLFLGPFEDIYFTYQDQIHFNIFFGQRKVGVEKLSLISKKVMAYQTELFKKTLKDRYLYIFRFFNEKKGLVSQAYTNSSIINISSYNLNDNIKDIGKRIGSNFFQRWIQPLYLGKNEHLLDKSCNRNLWFWAGLCEYYGSLTMVRQKIWDETDFLAHYIKQINQLNIFTKFHQYPISKLSFHIAEYNEKNVFDYIKLKGEVLCLLLDLKIREVSQNKKNLDDVVRFIYDWYVGNQSNFRDEDVLRIINSVTSEDFTTFFDLYIDGKIDLPLKESLKVAGIIIEAVKDTIPELGSIGIDRGNKFVALTPGGSMELAGIKIGDKLLSFNSIKIGNQFELKSIIDTLKVGQEIEVMIEREGLSLLNLLKVPGREVSQIKSLDNENLQESQISLRKNWLYNIY